MALTARRTGALLALGLQLLVAPALRGQDSVIVIDPDAPPVDTLMRGGAPREVIAELIAFYNDSATTRTVGDVPSETGRFRITWETSNESPAGAGAFKLTLRSAISGRTIGIVADHKGTGTGTAEYDEGPRTYDFLVESANVDWKFRVEETSGAYKKGALP